MGGDGKILNIHVFHVDHRMMAFRLRRKVPISLSTT